MTHPGHLPRGVTIVEGQLEIDTSQLNEDGVMELLRGGFISSEDVDGLRRRIAVTSSGGGGIGSTGAQGLNFNLGQGLLDAIGNIFGSATNAIIGDSDENVITIPNRQPVLPRGGPQLGPPPPPGGTSRTPDQPALPAGAPTRNSTGDPTADAALLAGDVGQANILLNDRGFRIEEVQRRSVNPLTGELFDTVDQFLIPTTTIAGQITDSPDGGASFLGNPLLDQAQFQFEQQQRNDDLAREAAATADTGPGDRTAENVAITELLLDPRSRNLIKILQARDRGDRFVQDFNLPPEVLQLFGGSSPELGLRVSGAGTEPNLSPGQRELLGIDIGGQPLTQRGQQTIIDQSGQIQQGSRVGESIGTDFADVVSRDENQSEGGFLQKLFAALPAFDNNIGFGPALQNQLTPGTARGFNADELGALQAAFINSGTTLGEQQRLARRSALPGGR